MGIVDWNDPQRRAALVAAARERQTPAPDWMNDPRRSARAPLHQETTPVEAWWDTKPHYKWNLSPRPAGDGDKAAVEGLAHRWSGEERQAELDKWSAKRLAGQGGGYKKKSRKSKRKNKPKRKKITKRSKRSKRSKRTKRR